MTALNRRERRYWLRFCGWLVVAYLGLCALAWLVSDSMIFAPRFGARTAPDEVRQVGLADGSRLDAVFLPNPDARFTLWYFHGNAESLADIGPRLHELRDLGFSVFAVE